VRVWLDIEKPCCIIRTVNMQFFLLYREVLWGNLQERDHLDDLHIGEDNITIDFQGMSWGRGLD
jgi:hypothetical protein